MFCIILLPLTSNSINDQSDGCSLILATASLKYDNRCNKNRFAFKDWRHDLTKTKTNTKTKTDTNTKTDTKTKTKTTATKCDIRCPITAPVSRIRDLQLLADLLFPFNKYPLCQLASEHMALPQLFGVILTLPIALAPIACAFYITRHCDALFWTVELNIPGIYTCYIYTFVAKSSCTCVCMFLWISTTTVINDCCLFFAVSAVCDGRLGVVLAVW